MITIERQIDLGGEIILEGQFLELLWTSQRLAHKSGAMGNLLR